MVKGPPIAPPIQEKTRTKDDNDHGKLNRGIRVVIGIWPVPFLGPVPVPNRSPHEHRLDLADSEDLGMFHFLVILGRKRSVSFKWWHRGQLPGLEEGSCQVSPPGSASIGFCLLGIWLRSVACLCRHTGFHT
jgi:hypothetical protein